MGLLLPAAGGATATELTTALQLPPELSGQRLVDAVIAVRKRLPALHREGAAELRFVADLWTAADLPVRPESASWFAPLGAAQHSLPFATDPEAARTQINAQVAKATNGRIADALGVGAIARDTGVVLTTAMWFTASWRSRFWESATMAGAFTLADGTEVTVPMMASEGVRSYAESDEWQYVQRGLEGSFVVEFILPRVGRSLLAAERALLDGSAARQEMAAKVDMRLPRFEVGRDVPVRAVFEALGALTAFTEKADFTGLSPVPVRLDTVALRTVFRVDEKGVEGGAVAVARGPTTGESAIKYESKTFHAVRPFAFVVRERETGLILFVGRVDDPRPR